MDRICEKENDKMVILSLMILIIDIYWVSIVLCSTYTKGPVKVMK